MRAISASRSRSRRVNLSISSAGESPGLIADDGITPRVVCMPLPIAPRSARRLRPPGPLWQPPVDPFQEIPELRRRDRHRPVRRRRPDEPAMLQSLGEKTHALAVVPQHLDQVAAPAAEHDQVAAMRIALEGLLDQERKPIESLTHV